MFKNDFNLKPSVQSPLIGLTQSDAVRGVPMSFGTTKLYYYTTREQMSEATKKCAKRVGPI